MLFVALSVIDARTKGIINIAVEKLPSTYDIQDALYGHDFQILCNLYSRLIDLNSNGGNRPGIFESWSNNGSVFTFKIRESFWSDGNSITADDVLYSLNRGVNRRWGFLKSVIATDDSGRLMVEVVDSNTIRVHMRNAGVNVSTVFARVYVLPKHVIERYGDDWTDHFVSAGPYTLGKRSVDNLNIIKNDNYYAADSVTIKFANYILSKGYSTLVKFKSGDVDAVFSGIPESYDYKVLNELFPDNAVVMPSYGMYYIILNTNKLSVNIRRALAYALNRSVLVESLDDAHMPSSNFIYNGENAKPVIANSPVENSGSYTSFAYYLDRAKKLITPHLPLKISFRYVNDSILDRKIAHFVKNSWSKLDIDVSLEPADVVTHYSEIKGGNFDAARIYWLASYPDPIALLEPFTLDGIFASNNAWEIDDFTVYVRNYISGKTDKSLSEAKILMNANAILVQDVPVIPLMYHIRNILLSSDIKDFPRNATDSFELRFIRLAV